MKAQKIKAENVESFYDAVDDVLYVRFKKNNYKYSEDADDIILDFNKKNELIGIEILNATKFFNATKTFLKYVVSANFQIKLDKHHVLIKFSIESKHKAKRTQRRNEEDSFSTASSLHSQRVEYSLPAFAKPL